MDRQYDFRTYFTIGFLALVYTIYNFSDTQNLTWKLNTLYKANLPKSFTVQF